MKTQKYKWILYVILITIILSVLSLLYFNYINYLLNKSNFIHKVQQSIDVATDNYFAERAKKEKDKFKSFFTRFDKQNKINNITVNAKSKSKSISISVKKESKPIKYTSNKILFFPFKKR